MNGRPKKGKEYIISIRNTLILQCLKILSQADTARVFRLPRNTVCTIYKNK